MTKKEMIEKLAAEGKGTKTELRKKSVEELKAMVEVEVQPVSEDKAGEVEAPKEEKVEEGPFVTYCGSPFDPSHNSDCHVECQQATPEQYNRCVEHFKAKAVAPKETAKARSKSKRGKNRWGHLIDSQAELIDRVLLTAEGPITLDKIAEFAEARKPRTRHHLMHLINEWKVDLRINGEKGIFLAEKFEDLCGAEGVVEFK